MSAAEDSLFADDASPALMAVRSSDLLEHVGLTPYYQDELVKIFHADTLNALDAMTGNVSAVVTDPPYASGARTEAQKSSSGAMMRGQRWASKPIENDQMTTVGYIWLMRELGRHARRLLPEGGSMLCFTDWRQWPNLVGAIESTNLRVQGMVVWDKKHYALGNGFRSQHELIMHAANGVPLIDAKDTGNVLQCSREEPLHHPSPKPEALMQKLIRVVTPAGGTVLDPFMGGGSTLLAAKSIGRRAIGIEIEERYCERAAKRCASWGVAQCSNEKGQR